MLHEYCTQETGYLPSCRDFSGDLVSSEEPREGKLEIRLDVHSYIAMREPVSSISVHIFIALNRMDLNGDEMGGPTH